MQVHYRFDVVRFALNLINDCVRKSTEIEFAV